MKLCDLHLPFSQRGRFLAPSVQGARLKHPPQIQSSLPATPRSGRWAHRLFRRWLMHTVGTYWGITANGIQPLTPPIDRVSRSASEVASTVTRCTGGYPAASWPPTGLTVKLPVLSHYHRAIYLILAVAKVNDSANHIPSSLRCV